MNHEQAFIYGLVDPRDRKIYYVGLPVAGPPYLRHVWSTIIHAKKSLMNSAWGMFMMYKTGYIPDDKARTLATRTTN